MTDNLRETATDILTAAQAAAYLKLTRRTLYVLAKEGKIPAS